MAQFLDAILPVIENEGGYVNDPTDNGGETYKGISRKFHPEWSGWGLVDNHKPLANKAIIKNQLVDNSVLAFYRQMFWNKIQGDKIKSQEAAKELLDSSVNMGVSQAIKLTQRVLGLPETGVMDDKTLAKLNENTI